MPQHAISTGESPFEVLDSTNLQENAAMQEQALTSSPSIAGNDVSSGMNESRPSGPDNKGPESPLHGNIEISPEIGGSEKERGGNNDNVPLGALVVVPTSALVIASARPKLSKPSRAAAYGGLALLGLGAGVYAYSGSKGPTIAPAKTELSRIANPAPAPDTPPTIAAPAPFSGGTKIASASGAPAVREVLSAPAAAAEPAATQPAPARPPAAAPEEKAAIVGGPVSAQIASAPAPALVRESPAPRAPQESRVAAIPGPATSPTGVSAETPPRPPAGLATLLQGPARGQIVFVQRPNVNIRNAPSQNAQILGAAQMGGQFMVARRDGEWIQVQQGPWRGWINQRFLGSRLPRG